MKDIYFTVTGLDYNYGDDFIKRGMKVTLEKDMDNIYDTEAIMVKMEGLGKIGYVANSYRTVLGECMSAGRLYDKIENIATGKVAFVTNRGLVCKIDRDDVKTEKKICI